MKPTLEQIRSSDGQSFRFFERKARSFEFRWHQHRELELTLIVSGRGQRYVGDHVGPYGPGDLVLIGPNLPHTWRSEGMGPQHAMVIQFDREFVGEDFLDLPECRRLRKMLDRSGRGLHFSARTVERCQPELLALLDVTPFSRLTSFLNILDRLAASRPERLSSPEAQPYVREIDEVRIAKACAYIQAHFTEGMCLEEVAAEAGMGAASFSRYFKHHTGRTFMDYLNDVRIGHACRLLIETDEPVTEICFASGFGNLSNFNRRFKLLKEMTPRAYRSAFQPAERR